MANDLIARELRTKWLNLADEQMRWSKESDAKGDGANAHTERGRARIYRECAADLESALQPYLRAGADPAPPADLDYRHVTSQEILDDLRELREWRQGVRRVAPPADPAPPAAAPELCAVCGKHVGQGLTCPESTRGRCPHTSAAAPEPASAAPTLREQLYVAGQAAADQHADPVAMTVACAHAAAREALTILVEQKAATDMTRLPLTWDYLIDQLRAELEVEP